LLAKTADARGVGLAPGEDRALQAAVAAEPAIDAFLRQRDSAPVRETLRALHSLAALVVPRA